MNCFPVQRYKFSLVACWPALDNTASWQDHHIPQTPLMLSSPPQTTGGLVALSKWYSHLGVVLSDLSSGIPCVSIMHPFGTHRSHARRVSSARFGVVSRIPPSRASPCGDRALYADHMLCRWCFSPRQLQTEYCFKVTVPNFWQAASRHLRHCTLCKPYARG